MYNVSSLLNTKINDIDLKQTLYLKYVFKDLNYNNNNNNNSNNNNNYLNNHNKKLPVVDNNNNKNKIIHTP
jgi:hypothetical protein